ncbi:MAG: protein kinase [Zavarzinella sp.]
MKKLSIEPINQTAIVQTGTRLLTALLAKNLSIQMSCGGKGICSTCHIKVKSGQENLSPMRDRERRTLKLVADSCADSRLACQASIFGDDIRVEVPQGMYLERADDLIGLLGMPAPENILHPIRGHILIPKGKLITRTMLEQSRNIDKELEQLKKFETDSFTNGTGHAKNASTVRNSHNSSQLVRVPIVTMIKAAPNLNNGPKAPRDNSIYETPSIDSPASSHGSHRHNNNTIPASHAETITHSNRPTAPEPGLVIDKYLLLEQIGKGGAGVVFRALHQKLNNLVAIKFLRNRQNSDRSLEKFCAEARILAQMSHPNIVRIFDFEDSPELPYVVMEFVDGVSGAELIKQSGKVQTSRSLSIISDICEGLTSVKHLGIVHRDIKPANILVDRSGKARLVDFGLARRQTNDTPKSGDSKYGSGFPEGTAAYMSPEQIQALPDVDHRTDIYSLGATLFHFLTGRIPFPGNSPFELIGKHLNAPVPLAHELESGIPKELSLLIQKMMHKNPAQRFQDYDSLINQIRQIKSKLQELVAV